MLFDWFTVIAQIINFLVLVLLLKRFLYGPIIRAMNEREAKIAAQLAEAEALKKAALEEAERYRQQSDEMQAKREEMLFQSKEAAEAWRRELIDKAHKEVEEVRAKWHEVISQEQQEFLREFRHRMGKLVSNISRRALSDLANVELEQQMIETVIHRIRALDNDDHQAFSESIRRSEGKVVLYSAFEISPPVRQEIVNTLCNRFEDHVDIEFKMAPELLCGIEVKVQDYKLAWTLDDYLESLEGTLFEALEEETEKQHDR